MSIITTGTTSPIYFALSTDLINGKLPCFVHVGSKVCLMDLQQWFIVQQDNSLESYSEFVIALDDMHFRVLDGDVWACSYYADNIVASGTRIIGILTGSKLVHIAFNHATNGDGKVEYHIGNNVDFSGGSPLPLLNHNVSILTGALTVIIANPTIINSGSIVRTIYLPGGSGTGRVGGRSPLSQEFVLHQNSKLYFTFTNLDGKDGIYNPVIDFYEI